MIILIKGEKIIIKNLANSFSKKKKKIIGKFFLKVNKYNLEVFFGVEKLGVCLIMLF